MRQATEGVKCWPPRTSATRKSPRPMHNQRASGVDIQDLRRTEPADPQVITLDNDVAQIGVKAHRPQGRSVGRRRQA